MTLKSSPRRIPLSTPHMSDEGFEQQFIAESFATNYVAPAGPMLTYFEHEVSQYIGVKHAAAVTSGTAAIHLALKAAGVKEGDIVFCQSFTFVASANPILYEKAIPVFIDSEAESWNMSPIHLEAAFKTYPNVKAVVVVHLYGIPAQIDEIYRLCKQYQVPLIEDAAESLGSTYMGRHMGTFGDFGVLSFNGNKIITSAGGGMVLSNNLIAIEQIRFWSTQARDNSLHYEHSQLGYNYRMSSLSAAVGRGQLKVLDRRVQQRRAIHQFYTQALADIPSIKIKAVDRDQVISNAWLTCILLDQSALVMPLLAYLETQGIETRPLWKPMHLQPLYQSNVFVGNRASDHLYHHGLCLPSDSKLTQDDLNYVSDAIHAFFKR